LKDLETRELRTAEQEIKQRDERLQAEEKECNDLVKENFSELSAELGVANVRSLDLDLKRQRERARKEELHLRGQLDKLGTELKMAREGAKKYSVAQAQGRIEKLDAEFVVVEAAWKDAEANLQKEQDRILGFVFYFSGGFALKRITWKGFREKKNLVLSFCFGCFFLVVFFIPRKI